MTIRDSHTYDNLTLLKDAGAITASAAATVASVARVLDLGDAAHMKCDVVIDPSAVDFTTTDETYDIAIQGSTAANMASPVQLASIRVASANRHVVGLNNQVGSTLYRYVRAYLTLAGTTPSFNGTIYLGKRM